MAAAVAAHVYTFPDSQPMPLRKASADLKSIRGKPSTMRTTRKQLHIITCVSLCDLVGLRTGADELHYCWMSVHFESHKNLYSDRLEDEILQVVPDRARLHLHCGDTVGRRNIASCSGPRAAASTLRRYLDAQPPPPTFQCWLQAGTPSPGGQNNASQHRNVGGGVLQSS